MPPTYESALQAATQLLESRTGYRIHLSPLESFERPGQTEVCLEWWAIVFCTTK